jgi:hypothetical protein
VVTTSNAASRPLRILFSMRNFWYVRLYESVIRELAARGHHVHILAEHGERNEVARDWNEAAAALSREYPTVSLGWAPRRVEDDWVDLRVMIRLGLDHLRFLEPEYAAAPKLAERARRRTPEWVVSLADRPGWRTTAGRRVIARALQIAERAMPIDPDVVSYIADQRPDVILITPLLTLGSEQQDVLRAGRRLGVPTVLCVGSWDHLSSKALIRERPDSVLVWNETQKQEAVSLHGLRPRQVVVTGAQCFDHWFDRQPSLDREAFCQKVGLDPSRPYVLYVCSALFEGSPNEAQFAVTWAGAVRAGSPALRDVGILIRPHPKRGFEWDEVDAAALSGVSLWPPRGAAPLDAPTKADYFDSMYHAAAVVGLNTSALIESGIVGRPVHTILLPEFYENQEGTLHFHYLLRGGLLQAARDLPAHVAQVAASIADGTAVVERSRAFVEAFVRPGGVGRAATPIFVDAVEAITGTPARPRPEPMWVPALRRALTPLALRTSGTFAEQNARERRRRVEERQRAERIDALERERAQRRAHRLAERARRDEEKRLAIEERRAATVREREARARALEEEAASARAAKLAAKQARLAEKQERKRAAVADAARRKRKVALQQRLRRVLHLFSAGR